jgi:hypothetical protein
MVLLSCDLPWLSVDSPSDWLRAHGSIIELLAVHRSHWLEETVTPSVSSRSTDGVLTGAGGPSGLAQ